MNCKQCKHVQTRFHDDKVVYECNKTLKRPMCSARVKNALLNQEIQNVNVCNVVTVDKFISMIREECRMPNVMSAIVNKMSDF